MPGQRPGRLRLASNPAAERRSRPGARAQQWACDDAGLIGVLHCRVDEDTAGSSHRPVPREPLLDVCHTSHCRPVPARLFPRVLLGGAELGHRGTRRAPWPWPVARTSSAQAWCVSDVLGPGGSRRVRLGDGRPQARVRRSCCRASGSATSRLSGSSQRRQGDVSRAERSLGVGGGGQSGGSAIVRSGRPGGCQRPPPGRTSPAGGRADARAPRGGCGVSRD